MKNLIQQLKDNEKPFGLMSEEMREKVKSMAPVYLECLSTRSTADNPIWATCEGSVIDWKDGENIISTFHLFSDYKDEPEIVELEIYAIPGPDGFHQDVYDFGGDTEMGLNLVPDGYKCIGFKFEDGKITRWPIRYIDTRHTLLTEITMMSSPWPSFVTVLHAIAVLFRSTK